MILQKNWAPIQKSEWYDKGCVAVTHSNRDLDLTSDREIRRI